MGITTNSPVSAASSATESAGSQKVLDFLGGILPDAAETIAPSLGIDPRVLGQTVSQVLDIFGIGGPGKAFLPTIPKEQAVSELQKVLTPHLSDPDFMGALGEWLRAAIEPVQAHKEGKAYQPDLSKSWITHAYDWAKHHADDVRQVAQVGMQALPYVMAAAG